MKITARAPSYAIPYKWKGTPLLIYVSVNLILSDHRLDAMILILKIMSNLRALIWPHTHKISVLSCDPSMK